MSLIDIVLTEIGGENRMRESQERDELESRAGRSRAPRRHFLRTCAGLSVGLAAASAFAKLPQAGERKLAFFNLHTGERLKTEYWVDGAYQRSALREVNLILRDFRTGDVHPIDPKLLDLLCALQHSVGQRGAFHVISGYRSPATNRMLRRRSGGVARHSLHMDGQAIDIRLPGCELRDLRDAARALRRGGVGYYRSSNFVHVDTGRVRYW